MPSFRLVGEGIWVWFAKKIPRLRKIRRISIKCAFVKSLEPKREEKCRTERKKNTGKKGLNWDLNPGPLTNLEDPKQELF
jgi:hypothetical protein